MKSLKVGLERPFIEKNHQKRLKYFWSRQQECWCCTAACWTMWCVLFQATLSFYAKIYQGGIFCLGVEKVFFDGMAWYHVNVVVLSWEQFFFFPLFFFMAAHTPLFFNNHFSWEREQLCLLCYKTELLLLPFRRRAVNVVIFLSVWLLVWSLKYFPPSIYGDPLIKI